MVPQPSAVLFPARTHPILAKVCRVQSLCLHQSYSRRCLQGAGEGKDRLKQPTNLLLMVFYEFGKPLSLLTVQPLTKEMAQPTQITSGSRWFKEIPSCSVFGLFISGPPPHASGLTQHPEKTAESS